MKTVRIHLPKAFHAALVKEFDGDVGMGVRSLMRHYGMRIHECAGESPYMFVTSVEEVCAAWVLLSRHKALCDRSTQSHLPPDADRSFGDAIIFAEHNRGDRAKLAKFGIKVTPKHVTFTDDHPFIRDIWELHGFGDTWRGALLHFRGAALTPCERGVVVPYHLIENLILEMPDGR